MTESATQPTSIDGALPGLREIRVALRRKRSVWVSTALIGLLLGCSIHLFLPRKYSANSHVYLVQPTGADAQQAIAADASLAQTRVVADQAITNLKLRVDPITFMSSYKAVVVSDDIVSIVYNGHTEAQAVQYCNAVAQAFLHVRNSLVVGQIQGMISGLQTESNALAGQITTVNQQISTLSGGDGNSQAGSQEADLVNQRVSDESQVAQIQGQISQAYLEQAALSQGSRILDPAAGKPKSAKKILITDGLSGLIAGLAAGALIVVIIALVSDRPRHRAEVSAALAAPIALSTPRWRIPRVRRWARLRRRLRQPDQNLRTVAALLRQYLETSTDDSLCVIAIGDVIPAALAVCLLAQQMRSSHPGVQLIDLVEGAPCRRLVAPEGPSNGQGALAYSTVTTWDEGERTGMARLVLATVDPARGAWQIASVTQDAVAMVGAGQASSTQLQSIAQLLRVAEVNLRSAILLGSDVTDDTAGVAPILVGPTPRHLRAGHGT